MKDKLTVEEAEKIANTRCDDASRIAHQLATIMRENERLHDELAKWEALYGNPLD